MYEKITVSKTVSNEVGTVEIVKFKKVGTTRVFWAAEFEGKRIGTTMWARMNDATKLAKRFLIWKANQ